MNSCEKPINDKKNKSYILIFASALLVACITFFVYSPALKNDFVNWDDDKYVFENNNIKSLDYNFFKWVLTSEVNANWHPLTVVSYALDYAFWGLSPKGYHLTNIIFHTANTLLVFILVLRLIRIAYIMNDSSEAINPIFPQRDISINRNALPAAIVTALLFGIHPLRVESVAWVSERKDVLYAFFYLLSILFYIKYASTINDEESTNDKNFNNRQQMKFYLVSFVLFIFSIVSKPMAVTLPFVLFLIDIYPLRRLTLHIISPSYKWWKDYSIKKVVIEKIPFIVIAFFSSIITIWAQKKGGALQSVEIYSILHRLCIAVRAYIFYLWKMLLPVNLSPYYTYPSNINIFSSEYLGAFLLLVFITYLCLRSVYPVFLIIWGYYIVTLFPVIGIVQVGAQSAADRYTYLPVLGFFILAGLGIQYLFNRYINKRYVIIVLIAGMTGIFGIMADLTAKQIAIWKDSNALWSYEIKYFPDMAIAYNNRGNYYNKSGNYKQSISDFNRAVNIAPMYATAYYNRGLVYAAMNNIGKAIEDYGTAIKIDPNNKNIYYNRGILYHKSGNYRQAILDYNKAIELDNKYAWAYNNRANVYYELGNYQEAVKDYKNALEYDPNIASAYYNLSLVYSKIGDTDMADKFSKKAGELSLNRR